MIGVFQGAFFNLDMHLKIWNPGILTGTFPFHTSFFRNKGIWKFCIPETALFLETSGKVGFPTFFPYLRVMYNWCPVFNSVHFFSVLYLNYIHMYVNGNTALFLTEVDYICWLQIDYKKVIHVYKSLNNICPAYMCNKFTYSDINQPHSY